MGRVVVAVVEQISTSGIQPYDQAACGLIRRIPLSLVLQLENRWKGQAVGLTEAMILDEYDRER